MDGRLLNLRLQAERRTVQPDHDLMLWAHDEIERLRAGLNEILTNGRWTEGEQRGEWAVSKEVYETAAEARYEQYVTEKEERE